MAPFVRRVGVSSADRLCCVANQLDSGERFYGHRIIFCAQSPFFRALLDQKQFRERVPSAARSPAASASAGAALSLEDESDGKGEEECVALPEVNAAVMRLVMAYVYCGDKTYARDDLALGIDLLQVSSRWMLEPLREHCERTLASRLTDDSVIGRSTLLACAVLCCAVLFSSGMKSLTVACFPCVCDLQVCIAPLRRVMPRSCLAPVSTICWRTTTKSSPASRLRTIPTPPPRLWRWTASPHVTPLCYNCWTLPNSNLLQLVSSRSSTALECYLCSVSMQICK
jgi:hypothetical protein